MVSERVPIVCQRKMAANLTALKQHCAGGVAATCAPVSREVELSATALASEKASSSDMNQEYTGSSSTCSPKTIGCWSGALEGCSSGATGGSQRSGGLFCLAVPQAVLSALVGCSSVA